jgi:hypothetical protein
MLLNKKYLYIAIGVLLLLVLLGWYFYRQGKKTVTLQSAPGELPGNPTSGNVVGASNDEIKRIANGLYGDMKGLNLNGHMYDPYNAAVLLNDADLIKLYNTFNTLYQQDSGETLTSWISNEYYAYPDVPGTLFARLKKLNAL